MMKQLITLIAFSFFALTLSAQTMVEKTPAFPGAEGFGRYTTGGRGGTVYHVTKLTDDGSEGTFRWACNRSGTRTIVFDVSGTIYLKSELKLKGDNITIAGQTAPGDGICVADYPFVISANNVIIRYMRFRLGNRHVDAHEGDGLGGMDKKNIIVDHCSVSWSVDECLSVYGSTNITVQWCIAAQSMVNSGHSKGSHGYGGNWGGSGATYHHNLIAHHTSRTPRLGPRPGTQCDERMDMRNNVIYNWGGNGCYGGEGMNVNIVNNYYKPGPATGSSVGKRIAKVNIRTSEYTKHDTPTPNEWDKMWHVWGHYFVEGNVNTKYAEVTNDNWGKGFINQIDAAANDGTFTAVTKDTIKLTKPIDFVHVTNHTAEKAYEKVIKYVGCSKSYDAYDKLILDDVKNGTAKAGTGTGNSAGFINTQNDVKYLADSDHDENMFPTLNSLPTATDTDKDGMPDEWETAHGLNPNDANDGKIVGADGYTNLENYLNSLVADITEGQLADGEAIGKKEEVTAITAVDYYKPLNNNVAYNLQGQRVGDNHKGIIIKNGRKILKY
ncbi:MAG: pectate lyase [Bacteroidaceae bacterium]|nr:pectate lyase [Bacteroidaceae bacterium]